MAKNDDLIIIEKKKGTNFILWFFFGFIGFIVIYFPLFGGNLRYTTGSFFSTIFKIC